MTLSESQPAESAPGLRSGVLSPLEILAQSIALLGPTITPAMIIPLVFAASGNGTWLVFVFATLGVLLTAITLNCYSTRSASTGSIYGYVQLAFGERTAIVAGWALFFAYITGGAAALVGFANYLLPAISSVFAFNLPAIILLLGGMALCWFISFKDIQLSTNVMLGLECVSVLLIIVVVMVTLCHHGLNADQQQLHLTGLTAENFRLGLVMAIFSFVGFESASTLGEEAHAPLKTIPAAMILSVVLTGALFVVGSYAEIIGFEGAPDSLAKSSAPLNAMATRAGVPYLSLPIDLGASVSFFSCVLAAINAGARVLFSMANHGAVHRIAAITHPVNKTPYVAAGITTVLMLTAPAILISLGYPLLDVYGWIGTISTFGFITAYIMACIGAPFFLKKVGGSCGKPILFAAAAIIFLTTALAGNIWPVPAAPYCYLPYLFLGYMVLSTSASLFFLKSPR